MTLIERLRGWLVADYIEAYTTGSTLIREAADEIERLTAERDALRSAVSEPVATLHDDGSFTWKRDEYRRKYDRQRAGWRMDVCVAIDAARKA